MRISLLFLSIPVILTLRYGSNLSKVVPSDVLFEEGDINPGSGCPYTFGSLPNGSVDGPPNPAGATPAELKLVLAVEGLVVAELLDVNVDVDA